MTKLPPHDPDAEKAVLGCVLLRPSLWTEIQAQLWRDAFMLPAHREIFEALESLGRRGVAIDPIAVMDEVRSRGGAGRIEGGLDYLIRLASDTPTSENHAVYADLVLELANKRRLISLCTEAAARAYGDDRVKDLTELLGEGLSKIATKQRDPLTPIGHFVYDTLNEFERRRAQRAENPEVVDGVRLGVPNADRVLAGMRPGDLVVIAAEPGGGKTALANQAALTLTVEDAGTALICQLEMPRAQLHERAFVRIAQVNSQRLKVGDWDSEAGEKLIAAAGRLRPALLYTQDRLFAMAEIVARAREWRAKHPDLRGLLVVDYLQLMRSGTGRETNRARELGQWCAAFKELAKELGVVVVLVSQFNRGANQQQRKPTMRDLRDSGEIEQAADFILLLHHDGSIESADDTDMDLIIEKNRNGPKGIVRLHWTGRYYMFENASEFDSGYSDRRRE